MQILRAHYRSRDEFHEYYSSELPNGGLFVPTTVPLEPGTEVVVELDCDGLPNKVLLRGTVRAWRPALPRLRVRAGATVEFTADERTKREFVLGAVDGAIPRPPRRRHARIPVAVPVTYRLTGSTEALASQLVEISIGGALLDVDPPPAIGTDLVLALTPPGGLVPMEILARVTYHARRGAGLKFSFRDGGGARRLRELIRRLRAS